MRHLPLLLGITLIVGMTIWEVSDFFVTNEGVRYFSSEPRRLVPVVLLGLAGGVVALVISRLSPRSQRTLKLAALGTFGALLLFTLALFAYSVGHLAPMVEDTHPSIPHTTRHPEERERFGRLTLASWPSTFRNEFFGT